MIRISLFICIGFLFGCSRPSFIGEKNDCSRVYGQYQNNDMRRKAIDNLLLIKQDWTPEELCEYLCVSWSLTGRNPGFHFPLNGSPRWQDPVLTLVAINSPHFLNKPPNSCLNLLQINSGGKLFEEILITAGYWSKNGIMINKKPPPKIWLDIVCKYVAWYRQHFNNKYPYHSSPNCTGVPK